jgi:hypothetical protein
MPQVFHVIFYTPPDKKPQPQFIILAENDVKVKEYVKKIGRKYMHLRLPKIERLGLFLKNKIPNRV